MREWKISLRVLRRLLLNSLWEKASWCDIAEARRLKTRLSQDRDLFAYSLAQSSVESLINEGQFHLVLDVQIFRNAINESRTKLRPSQPSP